MSYRLRYGQHDVRIGEEDCVIGRGGDCQLVLDDGRVPRRHAKLWVHDEKVSVEDLGSSNGTLVNGKPIPGAVQLRAGDRITIGDQELVVVELRARARTDRAESKTRRHMPTVKADAFGVVGTLADKALARKQGAEAERLLGPALTRIADAARAEELVMPATVERAASYALSLAVLVGKAAWVEYVFELFFMLRASMSADLVDRLYDVVRKVPPLRSGVVSSYVDFYRGKATTPARRFLLSRLEGLQRLIALR